MGLWSKGIYRKSCNESRLENLRSCDFSIPPVKYLIKNENLNMSMSVEDNTISIYENELYVGFYLFELNSASFKLVDVKPFIDCGYMFDENFKHNVISTLITLVCAYNKKYEDMFIWS